MAEFGFWCRAFCYGFSLSFVLGFALGGSFLESRPQAASRRTFRQNSDSGVVNFVMDSLYVLFWALLSEAHFWSRAPQAASCRTRGCVFFVFPIAGSVAIRQFLGAGSGRLHWFLVYGKWVYPPVYYTPRNRGLERGGCAHGRSHSKRVRSLVVALQLRLQLRFPP